MLNRATRPLLPAVLVVSLVALVAEAAPPVPKGQSPGINAPVTPGCPAGQELDPKSGRCAAPITCPAPKVRVIDRCFDPCPTGSAYDNSARCTICVDGYIQDQKSGRCIPPATCPAPKVLVPNLNRCFDPCPTGSAYDNAGRCKVCVDGYIQDQRSGRCIPPATCPAPKVLVPNLNRCFDPCPKGSTHDTSGKCRVCVDGYIQDQKTGACVAPL
jgi:hypothetical protein